MFLTINVNVIFMIQLLMIFQVLDQSRVFHRHMIQLLVVNLFGLGGVIRTHDLLLPKQAD